MKLLITGAAGFIGFHLVRQLAEQGVEVVGLDNINNYYPASLKYDRLQASGIPLKHIRERHRVQSTRWPNYRFAKADICDQRYLEKLFQQEQFTHVCHLAAQAGVRYSIESPMTYVQSNVVGFAHLLEACRHHRVEHLVFASSSSVYGLNSRIPFSTQDNVDHPISLYAATKKSNELMAHTYAHLYGIPCTGLRFFTVYGPWGRPDMAYFLFTERILSGQPIKVFNHGKMQRDFTYVEDIIGGIEKILPRPAAPNPDWDPQAPSPESSPAPYRIYNIGNHRPVNLLEFIQTLEKALGREAEKNFLPIQPGDVEVTYADVSALMRDFQYQPSTPLEDGIRQFVTWYRGWVKKE